MKMKPILGLTALILVFTLMAGCGSALRDEGEPNFFQSAQDTGGEVEAPSVDVQAEPEMGEAESFEADAVEGAPPADGEDLSGTDSLTERTGAGTGGAAAAGSNRLIIKNADVRLLVADTDIAVDRVTQIIDDAGGYIISSRVWYQEWGPDSYKYATITIGVPVDQFERVLLRLRDIAVTVLDERASGEDVTDEFVDLESQLRNLEATRDRIMTFLEQANTVEEALRVNAELSAIEAQIEEIQGRMNYLQDRASFSTITINLEPDLPELELTPTPTPTNTPTPTPTGTPVPWHASDTFNAARHTLGETYKAIADVVIWLAVVFLPIIGPPLLILYLVWRWRQSRDQTAPTEE
jgi:outer membrane lipopolysaccharide assembly protein LptE/RlpB